MSYINVSIPRSSEISDRQYNHLREAELEFWKSVANEYRAKLENIPLAIAKFGYVEISEGRDAIVLIQKPPETGK